MFAVFLADGYAAPSADVNKNGWQFLTFGMSAEQVDHLLVQNAMSALDFKSFAYRYYTVVKLTERTALNSILLTINWWPFRFLSVKRIVPW